MDEKGLYSIEAGARYTGLGRTKFHELLMSNAIESVTVGRRRLVPRASLDAFIERLRAEQRASA